MKRELFNLENLILALLFTALLAMSVFVASCNLPGGISGLGSITDNRDRDDRDRNSDRSDRRVRYCEDTESCIESCDYMFQSTRARTDCYYMDISDLDRIEQAFDAINDSTVNYKTLEDVDPDHLKDLLDLDVGAWVDVIYGGADFRKKTGYSVSEAKHTLEWIADDEDISDIISDLDDNDEILYSLFEKLGRNDPSTIPEKGGITWTSSEVRFTGDFDDISLNSVSNALDFVKGFISIKSSSKLQFGSSNRESFVTYAHYRDNESAIELAHRSAIRFCEDATGKSLEDDDEEVKQCLQAIYCSVGYFEEPSKSSGDDYDIFDKVLERNSSIFGNTKEEQCAIGILGKKTNFDDDGRTW